MADHPLASKRWADLTPEERASLPLGAMLHAPGIGSILRCSDGAWYDCAGTTHDPPPDTAKVVWAGSRPAVEDAPATCPTCAVHAKHGGGECPDHGPDPESVMARSSPRRPLDSPDLTCDWSPYLIPGHVGFVFYDCLDCLTRHTGGLPPGRLCPDRVKALQERLDGAVAAERRVASEALAATQRAYDGLHALDDLTPEQRARHEEGHRVLFERGVRELLAERDGVVRRATAAEREVALCRAHIDSADTQRDRARARAADAEAEVARLREALASLARFTTDDALSAMALAAMTPPDAPG